MTNGYFGVKFVGMAQELIFKHNENRYVDKIPSDCRCCLVFSGYKTITSDFAIKLAKFINNFIERTGQNIQVYSVVYRPTQNKAIMDWFKQIILNPQTNYKLSYTVLSKILFMNQAVNRIALHKYINEIFEQTILPRISDDNGNKLPVQIAKQNIRNITFVSHCYGGWIAKRLIQLMTKKLQELKYSDEDSKEIMRQMVSISQSPVYLFNDSNYSMLNFTSASDTSLYYTSFFQPEYSLQLFKEYNLIMSESVVENHEYIKQRNHFDPEHILWPLKNSSYLSESGKKIVLLLKTALYNAFEPNQLGDITDLFKSTGEKLNGETSSEIFEQLKAISYDYCKPNPRYHTWKIFMRSVFNKIR